MPASKYKRPTEKQRRLVDILISSEKITIEEAAVRAGFGARSAASTGSNALKLPHVRAYYDEQLALRSKRTRIDADYILTRLAEIEQMDVGDLYDERDRTQLKPVHRWPRIWRQYIKSIDLKSGKIVMHDKVKILELMGKHVGVQAFKDQVDLSIGEGPAARLAKALEALKAKKGK